MATPSYPQGTLVTLLKTDAVTAPTRQVIQARLARLPVKKPQFFDAPLFATLQAVCRRLIPPIDRARPLDIAGAIDTMLAEGTGDGWRYDVMPPDAEAYRQGLQGIDESADILFGALFVQLRSSQQDSVLRAVQCGDAPGRIWQSLTAACFFEELLAAATEACYAHPLVQESIGYAGMADAAGWHKIGLNDLESREPKTLEEFQNRHD